MTPRDARVLCARSSAVAAVEELNRARIDAGQLLALIKAHDPSGEPPAPGTLTVHLHAGCRRTEMLVQIPEAQPGQRLGAIVVLHGAGGSAAGMLPYFEKLAGRLRLAVLCPNAQLSGGIANNLDMGGMLASRFAYPRWSFTADDFPISAVRWALEHLDADPDRVFLAGLSMGGIACWNLAMRLWCRFAAAVPINGALSMWEAFGTDRRSRYLLPNLASLPLFVVHGALDKTISPDFDRDSIAQLRALDAKGLEYVEVPDGLHPLKTLHFEDDGTLIRHLEDWLRNLRRCGEPSNLSHRAWDDQHGRAFWAQMDGVDRRTGAQLVASRLAPDYYRIRAVGAKRIKLYVTSAQLKSGSSVGVDINGSRASAVFRPELHTAVETFQEHADPSLAAEDILTIHVPGATTLHDLD